MSAIIVSQLREDHAGVPSAASKRRRASILCHPTPQFGEIEYDWRQPGVNVPGVEPGSKLSQDLSRIGARRITGASRARSRWPALLLADAEIRPDQDVQWRMIGPILCKLLEVEERHFVDYGVGVSAGGSEEAIDMFPALRVSSTEP
jgi:hypothetical protein